MENDMEAGSICTNSSYYTYAALNHEHCGTPCLQSCDGATFAACIPRDPPRGQKDPLKEVITEPKGLNPWALET